jgi:formylglycine-generating enzyme required for sulfatase activity
LFTSPVGSFQPNAFGLYDMHGNALQWCSDWYGEKYYATSPVGNPTGPDIGGDYSVFRGSSWFGWPFYSGSAYRGRSVPYYRSTDLGFRVATTQ